jgi:flagellar basal body P-ring formation protein FlgA
MRWLVVFCLMPLPAMAESYVALRTIPARSVLLISDMTGVDAEIAGAVTDAQAIVGREARVTVFAGQPIRTEDFAAPIIVERNQIVALIYSAGGLQIGLEGRALDAGRADEVIRVMNLASRAVVHGTVTDAGIVQVGSDIQKE